MIPKSVLKSITWRAVASTATALIVFTALRGEGITTSTALSLGGTAGLIDAVVKFVLYIFHDEAWKKWGRA